MTVKAMESHVNDRDKNHWYGEGQIHDEDSTCWYEKAAKDGCMEKTKACLVID